MAVYDPVEADWYVFDWTQTEMRKIRCARASLMTVVALLFAAATSLNAQISTTEYAARRDSMAARIGEGVVVAFGGRTPVTDYGTFFQLPAFHYLTAYDEPDAAFVLVARGGHGGGTLFVTPVDPRRAFYDGFRPDSAATARSLRFPAR